MHTPTIGIVRGGPSTEYAVSLETGATVLRSLPQGKYTLRDVFIDRTGVWHMRGVAMEPARILDQVDAVFNALHGAYGEDGTIQRILDTHGVGYTGSDALASAIAMNKVLTKQHLRTRPPSPGFLFAADTVLETGVTVAMIQEVFERLSPPMIVKPAQGGSSIGMRVVRTKEELLYAVLFAGEHATSVLVEQFVRGREVTVAVVEDWRGESLYAFPPVEIRPEKSEWFDHEEKYAGYAREVCPAPLPHDRTAQLLAYARHVHRALGLRDYSRSDFIIGCDGIYFLEVNTLPGLTPHSLVPKALDATGATVSDFLDHLVSRSLARL